jgi:hypothetical protein
MFTPSDLPNAGMWLVYIFLAISALTVVSLYLKTKLPPVRK